ncbi:sigma 54-interacting transcriptional regulator [bacterium]|nr:sigma 54-interacting transcriptional regulator [bacterium]
MAILDSDLNIAAANEAIAEMLLLPVNKIIGKKIKDVFEKKFPNLIDVIQQTIDLHKGVRNYTIEGFSPSGETYSYLVSTAIIEEILAPTVGIVLILHDISEITQLRKLAFQMDRYNEIIGKSEQMKKIYSLIETISSYDTAVLILGETGTGKELIARTIHNVSDRKNKPFVPVNCSALQDNLVESELYGYVKGAFTGAASNRLGRFAVANGGTLFLDEIGTLSLHVQAKLLRVLQEKVVEPLGSSQRFPVNVRILSATNRDLAELVARGEFRDDLYYRLKVIQIELPPLRERRDDIPMLMNFFINRLNRYYKKNIIGVAAQAEEVLTNYPWPGNVRELENATEHAFVLARGALLELKHFPPEIRHCDEEGAPPPPVKIDLDDEEETIRKTLLSVKGNVNKAAVILDMHRSSLWRKMREFRIAKGFGKQSHK